MKYFLDTEFIEGFHKPLFGKRRHFIDLISIGIVREDGGYYHAINSEYDYEMADDWVKQNVILPMYLKHVHGDARNQLDVHNFHKSIGIPLAAIKEFVPFALGCWTEAGKWKARVIPEIYGYYADYDWVLLCSLFGRMIELPEGFPMYCIDLKQMMDQKVASISSSLSFEEKLKLYKNGPNFPVQKDEHDALEDARWNRKLYEYITSDQIGTSLDFKG